MVLVFFILRPLIYIIVLSLVCVTVFEPVHKKALYILHHKGLAALCTTIAILVVILVPFIFLGIKVFEQAQQFFLIVGSEKDVFASITNNLLDSLYKYVPFGKNLSVDIEQYVGQGSVWLLDHLGYVFGSATKLLFNFLMFAVITYYVLKDGSTFKKSIINLSPLTNEDDEAIFKKVKVAINSIIKGNLAVAFIQGLLTAIGFALFGVPNFMLWGVVATVAALIPSIGTAIVLIPGVVFVFMTKNVFLALGLLAWGAVVVGLIDNMLRPIFIGRGIKVHPLIVFLSVIGGIIFLGPIGFLLGPLAISLLFALLDIYLVWRNNELS